MTAFDSEIRKIFSPSGSLASLDGFEYRPQQEIMATAVADALECRAHLMVEAPTGVGKTVAYLIPSVLHALRDGRRAIISTHTKNLQEQLFHNDLPLVRSLIMKPFTAEILKGRRNYLCSTRLRNALAAPGSLFGGEVTEVLTALSNTLAESRDGDIETFPFTPPPDVWDLVCSEQGICSRVACGTSCGFQRLRDRLRGAQVIIMNHALFFSMASEETTDDRFIFDDDFVVFDEAHTLPAVAGNGIGKRVSRHQVLSVIHRLYNPRTKRGFLARQGRHPKALCAALEHAAEDFFASMGLQARSLQPVPNIGQTLTARFRIPGSGASAIDGYLSEMRREIQSLAEPAKSVALRSELAAIARSLTEIQSTIGEFLEQTDPSLTYWAELAGKDVALCASPVEIGDVIGPRLFKSETSVIMTSATLAVDNALDYAIQRVGATDIRTLILDSPFDHARQMKLILAADIAQPDSPGYQQELPSWILRSIDRSKGKALVLFTSAALMHAMATALRDAMEDRGITLLVQGTDLPRHDLLNAFKRDVHSVLFGLDSFWMGVDVPGEALEHVVITRLPFAAPNHPLVEARLEAIAQRGGQSFLEFTLPEAVLKFRQGVGRLIRSSADSGIVTILDSRIVHKRYGRSFINSIPRSPVELWTADGDSMPLPPEEW